MKTVISEYLEKLEVGPQQSYKNLAVFPLVSNYKVNLDYITLDEAVAANLIDIVEIDDGGYVPELKVANKSPVKILIIDGGRGRTCWRQAEPYCQYNNTSQRRIDDNHTS